MRHLKSGRKLGRTKSHRKATLSALSVALISHKKIKTTVAKAKEARMVVEKLVTRAKRAVLNEGEGKPVNIHARRITFSFLRDRKAVTILFGEIAQKVSSRPGGYTRVVKLGQRQGDGAEMALLEFVDYNLAQAKSEKPASKTKKATPKKKKVSAQKETASTTEAENTKLKETKTKSKPSDSEAKKD